MIEVGIRTLAHRGFEAPIRTFVEAEFISNIRSGKVEPPDSEGWRAHLLCHAEKPNGPRFVTVCEGFTEAELDRLIAEFCDRDDVTLMGEP